MNDLKLGTIILINNEPQEIIEAQHVKMGRGGAILRTKLKNLISGNVIEKTFKSGDKIAEAELVRLRAIFLYKEKNDYYFMDSQTYDQFSLTEDKIKKKAKFLKENQEVIILSHQDKPLAIELPKKVDLKVIEALPGVRGDTARGSVNKPVILETGYKINVPLFIKKGETIKVNTETGEYVERSNS